MEAAMVRAVLESSKDGFNEAVW